MTDIQEPVGERATRYPPPTTDPLLTAPPPPPLSPPGPEPGPTPAPEKKRRLTPKQLILTALVAVAVGVVGGTLIANALSSSNSSTDQDMGNWMSSYGSNYLSVSKDVAAVNAGTNATAERAACVKLQNDVKQADSNPAMPVGSLESQWSVILSNLSTTAHDCIDGIDQKSDSLLNTAQTHLTNASEAYLKLLKAVQRAGG